MSSELDTELRTSLCLMNELFENIIKDNRIKVEDIPSVDITTSEDFSEMGEMLLGKLSAIEQFCDSASSSTQKKYDARTIKDKIAVKKKQLQELESENTALVETAKRQEKALKKMNATSGDVVEAQQNIIKIKNQLQAAQKEIKIMEERRHNLLAENRRLKGQLQAQQKEASGESQNEALSEEELNIAIQQLKDRQTQLELRKQREKAAYMQKMSALKEQKDEKAKTKQELEQRIKEKEMQLKLIQDKSKQSIGYRK